MTSSADLFLIGMQKLKPLNIQTAVNVYLLPLDEGGWNSPVRINAQRFHWLHTWFKYSFFKLYFLNFLFYTGERGFLGRGVCSPVFKAFNIITFCVLLIVMCL